MKNKKNTKSLTTKHPTAKVIRKNSKNSTISKLLEEYQNFKSNQRSPITEHMLDRLSVSLISYAYETEILRVEWFFMEQGIPPRTARQWATKYESFGEAYRAAKMIIGMRREDGALRKKFEPSTVHFTLPLFDDDWREALELRQKLKSEEQDKSSNITVVIPPFASSDIVPKLPEQEVSRSPEQVASEVRSKATKGGVGRISVVKGCIE